MTGTENDAGTAETAVRLAVAAKRFRSRVREEAGLTTTGLSELQLAILIRLRNDGATTAACLAEAEHVSQQAIAQSLTGLKSAELVQARPDPDDRRKSLMNVTDAGRGLLETVRASRDTWLSQAIEVGVDDEERGYLDKAIELLERLADIDLSTQRGRQSRDPIAASGSAGHAARHTATEGGSTR